VYPGPIGAVITPQLMGLEKTAQLPFASSLCGACREVCPVKIDIPRLLLHLRAEVTEKSPDAVPKKTTEKLAFKIWAFVMMRPGLYELGAKLGRLAQRFVVRDGRIGKVNLPPLNAWTGNRDLRPIDSQSFREAWRKERR
jgi:L-lactate dehydrogenase complex protein LldF